MNYFIRKGDNLYEISKKHNVKIEDIMRSNPHINPYNLVIGTYIYIPSNNFGKENCHLKENMRQVWEQHVFWTRLLIASIVERLKDESETTKRLLGNPNDLAAIYEYYYGKDVANLISNLITEHLVIASKLVHAIIDNNVDEVNNQNIKWYKNADEIAKALSSINPHYNKDELTKMLYMHLDLTKEEVANRVNHNYKKEIEVFDNVEKQAIMMSDYFTEGINKQFG